MTKRLGNRARSILVAATSLLLTGCFESEQPKFPLASAAAPFGEGGRYVVYERIEDNRYQRQEVFVIKRRPDRAYDFVNEKGEAMAISMHAVGGDLFVAQAKPDKEKPDHGYAVFRVAGNEALLHYPQCNDQDKAVLATFGVEARGEFTCSIDRVADPIGLFKQLALGEPTSKLVRE